MAGFTDAPDNHIVRCASAAGTVLLQQFRVVAPRRLALPVPEPGPTVGYPIPELA